MISQDPEPGTLQGEEQIIQVVVSKGPNLVEMPNLFGQTQSNACKRLDELGIQYSLQMMDNDGSYAGGTVADWRTTGGDTLTAGTRFDAGKIELVIYIAGARDDTLVAETTISEELPDAGDTDNGGDTAGEGEG